MFNVNLKVFYCGDKCKYKDKIFHSNVCDLAYDSESDDEETNAMFNLYKLYVYQTYSFGLF